MAQRHTLRRRAPLAFETVTVQDMKTTSKGLCKLCNKQRERYNPWVQVQVELAALDYRSSRLVRALDSRTGERMGFGEGGTTEVVSARCASPPTASCKHSLSKLGRQNMFDHTMPASQTPDSLHGQGEGAGLRGQTCGFEAGDRVHLQGVTRNQGLPMALCSCKFLGTCSFHVRATSYKFSKS